MDIKKVTEKRGFRHYEHVIKISILPVLTGGKHRVTHERNQKAVIPRTIAYSPASALQGAFRNAGATCIKGVVCYKIQGREKSE